MVRRRSDSHEIWLPKVMKSKEEGQCRERKKGRSVAGERKNEGKKKGRRKKKENKGGATRLDFCKDIIPNKYLLIKIRKKKISILYESYFSQKGHFGLAIKIRI